MVFSIELIKRLTLGGKCGENGGLVLFSVYAYRYLVYNFSGSCVQYVIYFPDFVIWAYQPIIYDWVSEWKIRLGGKEMQGEKCKGAEKGGENVMVIGGEDVKENEVV